MKMLVDYLKKYLRDLILLGAFTVVFAAILWIYRCSLEAAFYGFAICFIIVIAVMGAGFVRFRRKQLMLRDIYANLPIIGDELPSPDNVTEEKLCEIITKLDEISRDELTDMRAMRKDSEDYFTVWMHQIKTPISAMQMLLQTEDTDTGRELSAELFRIEQYVEMALHYIRMDSGTNDLTIRRYELNSLVKQAVRRYAPLFIRKRIRLELGELNSQVLTDEKWLVFVIEQLLSNAVKYTIKGSVEVSLDSGILCVRDTGIGISPDDLPRIFEKGYTGMSGRTDTKSTGLGLYLCKRVCDMLGHRIYAESTVGEGTAVYIDLNEAKIEIE